MIFITGPLSAASGRSPGNSAAADPTCRILGSGRRFGVAGGRAGGGYDDSGGDEIGGGIVPMDAGERRARGRRPGGWPACWRRARTR